MLSERTGWVRSAGVAGGGLGLVLGAALLAAPPMGTDLAAQVAHADFTAANGATPVDMRWYGGTVQFGYSWISPWVMALLGARVTGALAVAASAAVLGALLARAGAKRPVAGALLGAVAFAGNLVSGRVTYGLGVLPGLVALLLLAPGRWPRRRAVRLGCAALGAALSAATSPVAGAFVGVAGAAIALDGLRQQSITAWRQGGAAAPGVRRVVGSAVPGVRRVVDGVVLAGGAGLPLLATALLASDGGIMNISASDALHAVVTGMLVAALVPVPVLRIGAVLSVVLVAGAYLVPSPVGLNATRLATMFALPLLAGYTPPPGRPAWLRRPVWLRRPALLRLPGRGWQLAAVAVLAVGCWQPPLLMKDLLDAGNPTASRQYFAPLLRELAGRRPTTRIEVPPTRDYWEAAYVAPVLPLARGWLRQVDRVQNPIFFDGRLDAASYHAWLLDNGVGYVALPDAELSWVGRGEAAVVASRPGYLREVWRSRHWTLFQVDGAPSVVAGGSVVALTADAVVFDAPAAGSVLVRVRPSAWLRVDGPAPARTEPGTAAGIGTGTGAGGDGADDGDGASAGSGIAWTVVRVTVPGRYTVTS